MTDVTGLNRPHSELKDQGAVLSSRKKEGIPDEDQPARPRREQ